MGFYADQVLPRSTDLALRGKPIDESRRRAAAGLDGEVLEAGLDVVLRLRPRRPLLPGAVDRVRAMHPATVGCKLAGEHVGRLRRGPNRSRRQGRSPNSGGCARERLSSQKPSISVSVVNASHRRTLSSPGGTRVITGPKFATVRPSAAS